MSGINYNALILIGSIIIVVFLVIRELWCWYWKINKIVALLQEQNNLLRAKMARSMVNLDDMFETEQGAAQDDRIALADDRVIHTKRMNKGTAQDDRIALAEWHQAAEQGDAKAQYDLGVIYYYGKGIAQDSFKAFEWFQKAAEQGLADAQYELGIMYYYGNGTAQDYRKALAWFQKAAEQGHAKAQSNLDNRYFPV